MKKDKDINSQVEYSDDALDFFSDRHASSHASFLLPYLRPGMTLLDCGCGPGSITLDLAEIVSPGNVIGIDIETIQIERAQSLREERNLENVRFEVGDVTDLKFSDGSFDVVFAHGVIEYLEDPVQVFIGMHNVLREGGILAIRHGDWGGFLFAPEDSKAVTFFDLFVQLMKTDGGDPHFGRNQLSYLRQAGFSDIKVSASYDCWTSSPDLTYQVASYMAAHCMSDEFIQPIIELGLSDHPTLEKIGNELLVWGKTPDAFAAEAWGEAIAYK
jgi:SAM-dependent methyltransferase